MSQKNTSNQLIEKMDSLIRAGQLAEVRILLKDLKTSSISREDYVAFANISRRIGLETWGLTLLRPLLRSEQPVHPVASVEERTMYAALLIKVGVVIEALELLEELQNENYPEVFLYLAYAHIACWEHDKVISYLKKYLTCKNLSEYQVTIAKVNLAAAYVADGNDKSATPILQEIEKLCRQNGWKLFLSNCLEISSQIAIRGQRWNHAEELLREAELQGKSAHKYLLFVEKWRAISKLSQNPNSAAARSELEEVRDKALQVRDWETIRDLDLQIGLHCNEKNLLEKLYFGTPYRQYRKKIEKIFKERKWNLPNSYNWPDHRSDHKKFFDPFDGSNNGVEIVNTGKTVHRLLILLSTDLYRPFAMAQIFSKIFVGEYFNPTSSPDRVYQTIQKARKLFHDQNVDIDIEVENGLCSLKCQPSQALVLRKKMIVNKTRKELVQVSFLQKLKLIFVHKSFSASQVAKQLNVSPGTARSQLASAEKSGSIIKLGNGRSTLYRLP